MSDSFHFEYGFQDSDKMSVTLTLDDDSELVCSVVAIFPTNDREYIALLPKTNGAKEVYLYRFCVTRDGDPVLDNIMDDDEFETVADTYNHMVDTQEDFFIDDEDL